MTIVHRYLAAIGVCAVLAFAITGCYKATIETGLAVSAKSRTIWAHSYVYGLVPPDVVRASSECDDGVAAVETQLTLANQLVGVFTFGIYTPMQITVTCAQSSALHDLEEDSIVRLASNVDYERTMAAFEEASNLAVDTDETVYVIWQ